MHRCRICWRELRQMRSSEPPLVLHVVHRLDFGGLENGVVNLVNQLPAHRYRQAIVCLSGFDSKFRQRIQRGDVKVVSLDKRPGKDLGAYLRFWRALRLLKPTIVHTRNLGTIDMQWIAAAAGVSHRLHGEHGWEASDPHGADPKSLRIRRACSPVIDCYVPMSQDIARWLVHTVGVEPARIRQLYSGVDTLKFHPRPDSRPAIEAVSGAGLVEEQGAGNLITIGTVGRLDPVKNFAALLGAFATLCVRVPYVRLIIVGDGPLRHSLETQAAALGIASLVSFTGVRDDTPDLMRTFDVFVLPSVNEGISNTILEAMATGLPVIAGWIGGNPEVVADGITGRLYDPTDHEALVQAILPYVTDATLRRAHGHAGRDRIVEKFRLDSMAARYLSLYDELLGGT